MGEKYRIDFLEFLRDAEMKFPCCLLRDMAARKKSSRGALLRKTRPPHPDDFLGRWGVWCCEGSGVSPSREDIGSLSDFPSFRDEARLDRCSQK